MDFFNKAKTFVKEAYAEMKKVSWLSKKEVIGSTGVIIVFIIMVSLFIGLVDLLLVRLTGFLLRR